VNREWLVHESKARRGLNEPERAFAGRAAPMKGHLRDTIWGTFLAQWLNPLPRRGCSGTTYDLKKYPKG
jgi:hypothetical protein